MSLQVETAEALCSAFYNMPFTQFLGETISEDTGEWAAWFHFGEKPKDMRVVVVRPSDREVVVVKVVWRNYHADPRNPLRGEQLLVVNCDRAAQMDLHGATEDVALKVLELFKQVLSEEGVAGRISDLVETPEETEE